MSTLYGNKQPIQLRMFPSTPLGCLLWGHWSLCWLYRFSSGSGQPWGLIEAPCIQMEEDGLHYES